MLLSGEGACRLRKWRRALLIESNLDAAAADAIGPDIARQVRYQRSRVTSAKARALLICAVTSPSASRVETPRWLAPACCQN